MVSFWSALAFAVFFVGAVVLEHGRAVRAARGLDTSADDDPLKALIMWEPEAVIRRWSREAFEEGLTRLGFVFEDVDAVVFAATREGERWEIGPVGERPGKIEVEVRRERGASAGECAASFKAFRPAGSRLRLSAGEWSCAVRFSGVWAALFEVDERSRVMSMPADQFVVRSGELTVRYELDARLVGEGVWSEFDELVELNDLLDGAVPGDEDAWLEMLEVPLRSADGEAAASYYEERVRRGHMSGVEAAARFLQRPPRELSGLEGLLGALGVAQEGELVRGVGAPRLTKAYEATLSEFGREHPSVAALLLVLARAVEPESLLEHEFGAQADAGLVSEWASRPGAREERLDGILSQVWGARDAAWRECVCVALSEREGVSYPRVIERAAALGVTAREHRSLAALVGVSREEVFEDVSVSDALVHQIEHAPVNSHGALVAALSGRAAHRVREEIVARAMDAPPLSILQDAAQVLCGAEWRSEQLERLSGALTWADAGPDGGLSLAAEGGGGLSEVGRSGSKED